jgi:hypothetical protein
LDEGQSPDQSENNINDINMLAFYHLIRWNLDFPDSQVIEAISGLHSTGIPSRIAFRNDMALSV